VGSTETGTVTGADAHQSGVDQFDVDQFDVDQFEVERRGLLAHGYRMLGSWDDAEDVVQETYLRAWRGWAGFEHRSSVRVWLYRIATNLCLTAIEGRARRALPSGLGAPAGDPDEPPQLLEPRAWIQPIPTSAVLADPAVQALGKEDVRLAFVAGLQYLPATQRAALLLRDVLAFSAAETAQLLDTSVPAVKSLLQRARARLRDVDPSPEQVLEPTDPRSRDLLDRYMRAWEESDVVAFGKVLRHDATLEPLPSRTWFAGKVTCVAFAGRFLGEPGDWRMVAVGANGQPAAATWFRGRPFGIAVLTPSPDGVARLTLFGDPDLVSRFVPVGVPREVP
jgi:RNA polymerase sigma-70 factor (ECF subfamily)